MKIIKSKGSLHSFLLVVFFPKILWACGGETASTIPWMELFIGIVGGSFLLLFCLLPSMICGTHIAKCSCGRTRLAKWTGTLLPCAKCGQEDHSNGAVRFYLLTLIGIGLLLSFQYCLYNIGAADTNGINDEAYIFYTWGMGLFMGIAGGLLTMRPLCIRSPNNRVHFTKAKYTHEE